jgi:phosphate butyryltransferase
MFKNFDEIRSYVLLKNEVKTIALCGSHDTITLGAVVRAKREGMIKAVLIGNAEATSTILRELGEDLSDYQIIDERDEFNAARLAFRQVKDGVADIPMKGLIQTQLFMLAVMYPGIGIMPNGGFLSEATVFHFADQDRLMIAADCAVHVTPSVEDKVKIINNAARIARTLGITEPKVAVLSAVERSDETIISSVEAAKLADMKWDGLIVEGPFALDNAVDPHAARHKGVGGAVAGMADILIMPDLVAGNVFHKAIHFFAHLPNLTFLCGTTRPAIMTSRTDSEDTKYYSILYAIIESMQTNEPESRDAVST